MVLPKVASHQPPVSPLAPNKAPSKKSRSKFLGFVFGVLKTPYHVVRVLCFWRKRRVKLLPEQKAMMTTILTDPSYLLTKQVRPIPQDPPKTPDIALEKLHTFTEGFCTNFADCLFDEKLKKPIETVMNGADSYEKWIKPALSFLVDIGDNVISTLTQSPNLVEDIKKFPHTENIDEIFSWLCKDHSGKNLREEVEKSLAVKVAEVAMQHNIELPKTHDWMKQYDGKILDWIFSSDHALTAVFTDQTGKKDKALFNVVIKAAVQLLLENKIEYFKGKVKDVFKDKLEKIVRELLKNSGQKVSTIVSDRLTPKMQNLDYSGMFDSSLKIVSKHVEAYISAEKKVNEIIRKAKNINSVKANTKGQQVARAHLEHIAAALKTEDEAAVKKKLMVAAFAEEPACSETVRQMIIVPDEAHRENTAKSAEDLYHASLSDALLELVLPPPTYNSDGSEKSGLEHIWDTLLAPDNLPQEINILLEELKTTLQQLVPSSQKEQFIKIQDSFFSVAKTGALSVVEKLVKQQIHNATLLMVHKLSNPDALEELLAYTMLPSLSGMLLVSATRQAMFSRKNAKKIATLYLKASKETDPTAVKAEISKVAFAMTKKTFHSFSSQEITEQEFHKLITPLINEVETMLKLTIRPDSSVNEVVSLMQEYYNGIMVEKNSDYESLIMNACFGVGSLKIFGGKGLSRALLNRLKGPVSQQITNAAYTGSHSYVRPLYTTLTTAQDTYGTKEQVKGLFFGEVKRPDKSVREAKLKQEINKTARLAHDILRQGVKNNAGSTFLMFVPSSKSCDRFLTDLVQKLLLTDSSINKSLLFQIQNTALESLKNGNKPK
ncbi:MAG: hypothetical protein CK425_02470 [Parachlamydia sp.]|nr:MAG: hypothetical protein CK425_02470 [Parachlamydia sp.]